MNGIKEIADSLSAELKQRLPKQRRTQRVKLALLVATMLDVRSANLMDLAAGLPRDADRTDMRYQWITRLLGNPLVISDEIMAPFSREVLALLRHTLERMQENQHARLHRQGTPMKRKMLMELDSLYRVTE